MNLLYRSCHGPLEYDEIRLFNELGCNVFSVGAFCHPTQIAPSTMRPPMPEIPYHEELCKIAWAMNDGPVLDNRLVEWADIIIFMGRSDRVKANWKNIKHKRTVFRSIGQCTPITERELLPLMAEGLEVIRYSPVERQIPGYAGERAMIRFYKDPEEFGNWTGENNLVMTIGQMVKHRDAYCGWSWFESATRGLPRMIVGPNNEDIDDMPSMLLDYEDMKAALRKARAFFYTGTWPAPYTMGFIEAFMTGTPIVAIGPQMRNLTLGEAGYEIPSIIQTERNGFWSDNLRYLSRSCASLVTDYGLAQSVSAEARKTAVELFGKEKIKEQWRQFLTL